MDILPGLLSFSQWLDEKGKTIKRNAQDLPGLLASFTQDVQQGAAASKSAWDASRSVMPGVREQGIREMNAQGQELGGLLGAMKVNKAKIKQESDNWLLGNYPTTTPTRIINKTRANTGYSVNLPTGDTPTEGLMMGVYRNTDPRNMVVDRLTPQSLDQFTKTNKDPLSMSDRYLGTWINPDNNKV